MNYNKNFNTLAGLIFCIAILNFVIGISNLNVNTAQEKRQKILENKIDNINKKI